MSMIICVGIAAAPVTESRRLERSKLARSGWLRMVWKIAGGPGSMVTCSSITRRMTAGTSNTGCGRIVAPLMNDARMPAFNPNAWKNGLMIKYRSPVRRPTTSAHESYARMLAEWKSIAPFGRPVVPDVKRMSQRSSGCTAALRVSSSPASTSSARPTNSFHATHPSGTVPRITTISSTVSAPGAPASRST